MELHKERKLAKESAALEEGVEEFFRDFFDGFTKQSFIEDFFPALEQLQSQLAELESTVSEIQDTIELSETFQREFTLVDQRLRSNPHRT